MPERLNFNTKENASKKQEQLDIPDNRKERQERKHEQDENVEFKKNDLEKIRRHAKEQAMTTQELIHDSVAEATPEAEENAFVNRELKDMAYQRLLKRTQRQLPGFERLMSKVIHQPTVSKASEVIGKSIGRPSGVLGGGLLALFGTSAYYFATRHYGYEYNFFIFVALIGLGFVLGWVLELLWRMIKVLIKK